MSVITRGTPVPERHVAFMGVFCLPKMEVPWGDVEISTAYIYIQVYMYYLELQTTIL